MKTLTVEIKILLCLFSLACSLALAEDPTLELESKIIGDKEQPKVMYIVPWKNPASDTAVDMPIKHVIDSANQPLDREIFIYSTQKNIDQPHSFSKD